MKTLLIAALLAFSSQPFAANPHTVTRVEGMGYATAADGKFRILAKDSVVHVGETITAESGSRVVIRTPDDGELTVVKGSAIVIGKDDEDGTLIRLLKGGMRSVTGKLMTNKKKDNWKLQTATATIGIRGTIFGAAQCEAGSEACSEILATNEATAEKYGLYVDVEEGAIEATNAAGTLVYSTGERGYIASEETVPEKLGEEFQFMIGNIPFNQQMCMN